jgi:hypothetical protein
MRKILQAMGGTESGWSRHNDEGVFRDYTAEADRLVESAIPYGLDYIVYDNDYIKNLPYYENHKDVLDRVSFGFCYKPICFDETLKQIEYDDIVLMTDSNHIIAKDPQIFFDIANQHGMYIRDHLWIEYPNKFWTRRDMFVNMGCDEERYWDSLQMQCNIIAICKTPKTMEFVKEWLDKSLNYDIMFGNNQYPNFEGFREHRHDQSLFSILREKYGFPYLNRTKNVEMEFIIPEIETITPEHIVDNSYRKEQDRKDIR